MTTARNAAFVFCLMTLGPSPSWAVQDNIGGNTKSTPLTAQQVSDQANAASQSRQVIEQSADGSVRMTAPMQDMEAVISPSGMQLRSVDEAGSAAFEWRVAAIGRQHQVVRVQDGSVLVAGDKVLLRHAQVTEEFSASGDGIRQDFVVEERPGGAGELELELAVQGATLETLSEVQAPAVALRMADGRLLHYHELQVTDRNGARLAARMERAGAYRLRLVVSDATAQYPLRIDPSFTDADWSAIAGPGFDDQILAMAVGNGNLYVGGNFTKTPAGRTPYVAVWNGSTWSALGSGIKSDVYDLIWDPANGRLYAGGAFSTAGGSVANCVAQWNGTAWSGLGSGMNINCSVQALAWDAANNRLFAGGAFTTAGGAAVNNIAQWDGSAWSALSSGVSSSVRSLAWDSANNWLYAGGYFTSAGGGPANRVARWNGSTWSALGSGMDDSVAALAWDAANGRLYAGGRFATAGGSPANQVAKWNGSTWSALGNGMNGWVEALAWDSTGNRLLAGGDFTTAGSGAANHVAQWNGTAWSPLGSGTDSTVQTLAWDAANNLLYASGTFTNAGGTAANHIAQWGGSAWSALGGGGTNDSVLAMAWDAANSRLFVGGYFHTVGGIAAGGVAQWNGSAWSALGDGLTTHSGYAVYALAWDTANNRLYAGGSFSTGSGGAGNYVSQWNGSVWSAVGSGMNDPVYALTLDAANGRLFAGGEFSTAGGNPAKGVAQWNGSAWSALGNGLIFGVYALAWDDAHGRLYAGGSFTQAGTGPANGIAQWNGSAWTALGSGVEMNSRVFALAWDSANNRLFAGGNFTTVGGAAANRVAQWNGTAWSALGSGTNNSVYTLAWDAANGALFAGGRFTTAGGAIANRIAQWNGSVWSPLGSGTDNYSVSALAWDAAGSRLFAAGDFAMAGGQLAAVAVMHARDDQTALTATATPPSIVYGGTTTLGTTGGSGNGSVSYAVTSGASYCNASGTNVTGTAIGSCTVTATKAGDANYHPAAATVGVTVERATGTPAFDTLSFTYDGSTKAITAHIAEEPASSCTVPASPVGPNAGNYPVGATCNGTNYIATGNDIAVINKATGSAAFDTLSFTYDGSPKAITAHIAQESASSCTVPASPVGPNAGSYPVSATCSGTNYDASGNNTAVIGKATTTLALSSPCMRTFVELQPFTLAASVTGVNPTGQITFNDGGSTLCGGVAVSSGSASCTSSTLASSGGVPTNHALAASYSGDTNHLASVAAPLAVTVLSASDVVFRHGFEVESLACPIE